MDIVIRASIMFAILFALLRLLGKRELSQMTPFEMVMLIVLGDLIQQGVTHSDYSLTGATLAICTFAFWSLTLNWITYKFPLAETMLEGEPSVIIRNGKILERNLQRDRITRAEIEAEMRGTGIGALGEVAWAIIETQGKISFIRKESGPRSDSPNDKPVTS